MELHDAARYMRSSSSADLGVVVFSNAEPNYQGGSLAPRIDTDFEAVRASAAAVTPCELILDLVVSILAAARPT